MPKKRIPRLGKPSARPRTPEEIAGDIKVVDEEGHRVAHVKTPSGRTVLIDAEDLTRLTVAGWSPALRLACPGGTATYVVTRKLGSRPSHDAIVARLVTGATEEECVRYLNGRFDLRRGSLGVVRSPARVATVAAKALRAAGEMKAA